MSLKETIPVKIKPLFSTLHSKVLFRILKFWPNMKKYYLEPLTEYFKWLKKNLLIGIIWKNTMQRVLWN